ncbi:hypothetical protein D3C73_1071970 [compost metagenome]
MLLGAFRRGEAGAFQIIDHGHRLALEQLAGGFGDFQVLARQLRVFREKSLGVALHERVIQRPPRQPQERHPDQFFLEEELEERCASVERLDQRRDIDPGLMVADHQVRGVASQAIVTANVPLGGDAQVENQLVDLRPGLGDPHHRTGRVVAKAAGQYQLEQGEHHQRPDQDQGVEQQQQGDETASEQAAHGRLLKAVERAMISRFGWQAKSGLTNVSPCYRYARKNAARHTGPSRAGSLPH